MTTPLAIVFSPSLGLVAGVVLLSVVLAAIDILRQPTWAWRAAGETRLVCLLLVLLLPGVGLAIYVFSTRPKLVEVTAAGRAANLPFERFGDQPSLATRRGRHIQAMAMPTVFGSFGERREVRTIRASGPGVGPTGSGSFFDDPDLITVGAPTGAVEPAPVATETIEPEIRIPGSLGRPYNPRQRTSLEGSESLAMASQIFGATDGTEPVASVAPMAAPARSFGAPPAPQGVAPVFGAVPAAQVPGQAFGVHASRAPTRYGTERDGATPQMATPRPIPGSPELLRPLAYEVAPAAGCSPMGMATMAPAAPPMPPQWLRDPTGRHNYRYWDGMSWTDSVSDAGISSQDPITG